MMRWRRAQRDFEDEIRSHIALEAERLIAEGVAPGEAEYAARRKFGNVGSAQQQFHDAGPFAWLHDFGKDVRYALRMLRKAPTFTIVAVITLALGIGANTAVFSVIKAVLLNPLPYREPDRLARLWETLPGTPRIMVSWPDYLDWKERARVFEDIAIFSPFSSMTLTGQELPEQVSVGRASANFFPVLGMAPLLGRGISTADDRVGVERVAVLTEGAWRRRYAADSSVLGRRFTLDGETYSIVGVMPATVGLGTVEAWLPIELFTTGSFANRGNHPGLAGLGRLKLGITIAQMNADLERVSSQIRAEHPAESAGIGASGNFLPELLLGDIKPTLVILAWSVALLLLIACANVANLLLGRSTARRKEIAVRAAMGASRLRIVRLLLVENLVVSLIGGALGVAVAYGGVRALLALRPTGIPRLLSINIDLTVLAFAAAVSILTGLVFGLLPARHTSNVDLNDALKETGRGTSAGGAALRARGALMVLEVSMAMMLLIGAGLLIRSFGRLTNVDLGVDADGVGITWISLPPSTYPTEERQRVAFSEIVTRAQALPGVTSAAMSTALPLSESIQFKMTFEGHPQPKGREPLINVNMVTPGYFATMRMRLVGGRLIEESDIAGREMVAVISESVARQYFPGENALGKRIVHGSVESKEAPWTVVGVVNDVNERSLSVRPAGTVYLALQQIPNSWGSLSVRSSLPIEQLLPILRKEVAGFDRNLPLANGSTLADIIGRSVGQARFTTFMLSVFAAVALILAVVGVYGVFAYLVAQRSHEIGIRMALGAQRTDIVSLIGVRVVGLTAVGVAIGIGAAVAGSGVIDKLLFEVTSTDVGTYVTGAAALIGAAILAATVPTLRATRVNPASTMRAD